MKKWIVILMVTLLFFGCGSFEPQPRRWTARERQAAGYFIFAHTLNAFSTEYHQDRAGIYYEANPLLGRHPSDKKVAVYFNITAVIGLMAAHFFPEHRQRILWDYGNANMMAAFHDYRMVRMGK